MPMLTPNLIKRKNVVRYSNEICLVLDCVVRTPPNNAAFAQLELRNLKTGRAFPVRSSTREQYEVLDNKFKTMEFSYENQGVYNFMDPQTYDQIEIHKEIIEDVADFLVPQSQYEIMFVEENPVLINLPASVTMKVTEAADAVRGDTSSNVTKQITLETGIKVNAPLFIKVGDVIKVSTEDKKYLGRA
jgi:elongation factor P